MLCWVGECPLLIRVRGHTPREQEVAWGHNKNHCIIIEVDVYLIRMNCHALI